MLTKLTIAVSLLAALGSAAAYAASDKRGADEIIVQLPQIVDTVSVPLQGLQAVETNEGKVFFLSENGRYVISGVLIDAWEKKPLSSISNMRFNFNHINLDSIGIKLDELRPITLGSGSQRVALFIDPQCRWCHSLIKEIMSDISLQGEYTFKIVAIPALGDESNRLSKILFCTPEDDGRRLNTLLDQTLDTLKEGDESSCKSEYQRLLVAAQMMDITRVPYLIAPDNRFTVGKPQDLKQWLTEGDAQLVLIEQKQKELLKQAADRLKSKTQSQSDPVSEQKP